MKKENKEAETSNFRGRSPIEFIKYGSYQEQTHSFRKIASPT